MTNSIESDLIFAVWQEKVSEERIIKYAILNVNFATDFIELNCVQWSGDLLNYKKRE